MINAQEARRRSESYSSPKWTIWDTLQEMKINRKIKSALKQQLNYVHINYLGSNVEEKLIKVYGYEIEESKMFGVISYIIKW